MCAHVRRGNFKQACRLYDEEMTTANPRAWVKQFAQKKLVCYVDENIFLEQVDTVMKEWNKRVLPILLITNDPKFAALVKERATPEYKVFTLNDLVDTSSILQSALPVFEISLCSRARVIVANQYSTFSRAIFKKALWKRKHMANFSFAWSKAGVINPFMKDWLERQLEEEIARREGGAVGRSIIIRD